MTAMPEASLARELGLCYTTLALVTDLDAGVEAGEGVTHAEVLDAFAANLPRLRDLLVVDVGAAAGGPGRLPVRRPWRVAAAVTAVTVTAVASGRYGVNASPTVGIT